MKGINVDKDVTKRAKKIVRKLNEKLTATEKLHVLYVMHVPNFAIRNDVELVTWFEDSAIKMKHVKKVIEMYKMYMSSFVGSEEFLDISKDMPIGTMKKIYELIESYLDENNLRENEEALEGDRLYSFFVSATTFFLIIEGLYDGFEDDSLFDKRVASEEDDFDDERNMVDVMVSKSIPAEEIEKIVSKLRLYLKQYNYPDMIALGKGGLRHFAKKEGIVFKNETPDAQVMIRDIFSESLKKYFRLDEVVLLISLLGVDKELDARNCTDYYGSLIEDLIGSEYHYLTDFMAIINAELL